MTLDVILVFLNIYTSISYLWATKRSHKIWYYFQVDNMLTKSNQNSGNNFASTLHFDENANTNNFIDRVLPQNPNNSSMAPSSFQTHNNELLPPWNPMEDICAMYCFRKARIAQWQTGKDFPWEIESLVQCIGTSQRSVIPQIGTTLWHHLWNQVHIWKLYHKYQQQGHCVKKNKIRLPYLDLKQNKKGLCLIATIPNNLEGYTKKEITCATEARNALTHR